MAMRMAIVRRDRLDTVPIIVASGFSQEQERYLQEVRRSGEILL
jgi:hypothetical protein